MPKKMSELLKDLQGETLETLLDDETGLSLAELKKRYGENAKSFTQASQEAAAWKKQGEELRASLAAYAENAQQWQTYAKGLENSAKQSAKEEGTDWRTDPLYAPIRGEIDRAQQVSVTIVDAVTGLFKAYAQDRQMVAEYLDTLEVERLKGEYKDFDVEKVRETAKRVNLNNWRGAYKVWKGEQSDTLLDKARQEGRDQALKEAQSKSLPTTEMTGAPPGPAPTETAQKDYTQAWQGLAKELQTQGLA